MAEVERGGTSAGFRMQWTFHKDYELHKVEAFSADIAEKNALTFAELLGVQVRFNPLNPNDKRYYTSFILNIREI